MLADNVDFIARYADHSEHLSSIHNGAAARLEHGWDFVLHAKPHALRVDVHDLIESLLVLLEERKRHLLDPGVVEGDVEPAELLQSPFDKFLHLDRLRDVGLHEDSFTTLGLQRSEEHTSELQSLRHLVCRLLLEKKKHNIIA